VNPFGGASATGGGSSFGVGQNQGASTGIGAGGVRPFYGNTLNTFQR
jgi:hypothetical protein